MIEHSLGVTVKILDRLLHKSYKRAFLHAGIRLNLDQFAILKELLNSDDEYRTQYGIAANIGVDRTALTRTIRLLVKRGLVAKGREELPGCLDKRLVRTGLTPAGRELTEKAVQIVAEVDKRIWNKEPQAVAWFSKVIARLDAVEAEERAKQER